jgi:hypothetical protein
MTANTISQRPSPASTSETSPHGLLWFAFTTVIALSLWSCVWWCNEPPRSKVFNYQEAVSAHWPQTLIFVVPGVHQPVFFDLQVILNGVELAAQGRDPYQVPATNERPYWYNYPSIWLALRHVGADLSWVRTLGLAMAAIYLVALLLATNPRSPLAAACTIGLMLAPPSLIVVAMANNEEVVFALLVLAGFGWERRWLRGWLAPALVASAGVLKLYPSCGLAAFVDGRRRTSLGIFAIGCGLAFFFALHFPELREISRLTPRPHAYAVGSQVLASRLLDASDRHSTLANIFGSAGSLKLWRIVLPAVSALILVLIIGFSCRKGWRDAGHDPRPDLPARQLRERFLFRLSALLHLAYFAIGHNWFYREVILILALPWLIVDPRRRPLIALILVIGWLGGITTGPIFILVQTCAWVLTGGLAYWLARDLSPDLRLALQTLRLTGKNIHS